MTEKYAGSPTWCTVNRMARAFCTLNAVFKESGSTNVESDPVLREAYRRLGFSSRNLSAVYVATDEDNREAMLTVMHNTDPVDAYVMKRLTKYSKLNFPQLDVLMQSDDAVRRTWMTVMNHLFECTRKKIEDNVECVHGAIRNVENDRKTSIVNGTPAVDPEELRWNAFTNLVRKQSSIVGGDTCD